MIHDATNEMMELADTNNDGIIDENDSMNSEHW
jgi:hypothetical protein